MLCAGADVAVARSCRQVSLSAWAQRLGVTAALAGTNGPGASASVHQRRSAALTSRQPSIRWVCTYKSGSTNESPEARSTQQSLLGRLTSGVPAGRWRHAAQGMTCQHPTDQNKPCLLKTPPGSSAYTPHVHQRDGKPVLVCTVGPTVFFFDAHCVGDLHALPTAESEWVELDGADEQKPARVSTVWAWVHSPANLVRRVARPQEGSVRAVRRLCCAPSGSVGSERAGTQPEEQPHAGKVSRLSARFGAPQPAFRS